MENKELENGKIEKSQSEQKQLSDMEIDCLVCKRLIEEKHRHDFIYKVGFFCMCIISVILAIMYFGSGALVKKIDVEVKTNGGDISSAIIGDNTIVNGTVTNSQNTLALICLSIICLVFIIGIIIIANHYIRTHNDRY